MSQKIQLNPSLKHWHIFHKGLIKILVNHQLCKMNRTWDDFLRSEGFEGMNISRFRGQPPKAPRDSFVTENQPAKIKRFPNPTRFTFAGKRKAWEPQEQSISKKANPRPTITKPCLKNPSPRRSTRHKDDKYTLGSIPSSSGVKKPEQIYKKRVRDTKEMVSEEDQNTLIRTSKRVKEGSQLSPKPLKSPVCKFENKRMNKKTVVKEGEMKTSPGLATEN